MYKWEKNLCFRSIAFQCCLEEIIEKLKGFRWLSLHLPPPFLFRSRHANRTHIIFYKRINGTVSCLYHLKLCAHGRDMLVFRMNTPTHRAPGRSVNIHIHKHAQTYWTMQFHTVMCANAIFARPQTNVFTFTSKYTNRNRFKHKHTNNRAHLDLHTTRFYPATITDVQECLT